MWRPNPGPWRGLRQTLTLPRQKACPLRTRQKPVSGPEVRAKRRDLATSGSAIQFGPHAKPRTTCVHLCSHMFTCPWQDSPNNEPLAPHLSDLSLVTQTATRSPAPPRLHLVRRPSRGPIAPICKPKHAHEEFCIINSRPNSGLRARSSSNTAHHSRPHGIVNFFNFFRCPPSSPTRR